MEDTETLLRQVVSGDFPRIFERLQLGGRYNIATSRIMRLHQALHDNSIMGIEHLELAKLRETATTLLELFRQLKSSPLPQHSPVAYKITEELIRLNHDLNQSPEFAVALDRSSRINSKERAVLVDTVGKLGQYYKASLELVLAARRRRCRIFQKIRVISFQVRVPENVRSPSRPGSALPLLNNLLEIPESSELLQRFRGLKSIADAALLQRLDCSRPGIKVHAEIKLLFFYETHPENVRPRIICASKSACYLCDLFLRVHGEFQTPSTFGKFYERWILPDWLDTIPLSRYQHLRGAVGRLSTIIDSEIGLALKSPKRLPDPLESVVGLAATWSNFSANNSSCSLPVHSLDRAVSAQADSELDPGPSGYLVS